MAFSIPGFDLVIVGATGDLAMRKLLPSLWQMHEDGQLPEDAVIVGVARSALSDEDYRNRCQQAVAEHGELDAAGWAGFAQRLRYCRVSDNHPDDYRRMGDLLRPAAVRVFYLATRFDLFVPVAQALAGAGLITSESRLVLEKPIGDKLEESARIEADVAVHFRERQIYRIDHYLGKETVQNLLVLRFANSIFESQWNQKYVDHVQITISESIGVGSRADFYERVGALRDMAQNHLLQLLCIVAMEPPYRLDADAVRDEKVKVLKSLKRWREDDIASSLVRGQYQGGVVKGVSVPAYLDEDGVDEQSSTETYIAMKVEIENWRWAGVPFYLRTGKRLAHRACEISVHFKEVPHSIFDTKHKATLANRLIFTLQPDEGVRLMMFEKRAGAKVNLRESALSLSPDRKRSRRVPDAYARLLSDVVQGNQTLFVRSDEMRAAWDWLDPVLHHLQTADLPPEAYPAGGWGPTAATMLLARDGRAWSDPAPVVIAEPPVDSGGTGNA